jgi:hypothetical protein
LLNIESLPSSTREPIGAGRSSGCSGLPPFFDVIPQSFTCHFAGRQEDECRCDANVLERAGSLTRAIVEGGLGSSPEGPARGQRKSKFTNPASTVACRAAVVDSLLAVDLDALLPMCDRDWSPRGAACSNMEAGPGFGLKKQTLSDCSLRNLRRADDGTRLCKVGRIAATRNIAIVNRQLLQSHRWRTLK